MKEWKNERNERYLMKGMKGMKGIRLLSATDSVSKSKRVHYINRY